MTFHPEGKFEMTLSEEEILVEASRFSYFQENLQYLCLEKRVQFNVILHETHLFSM